MGVYAGPKLPLVYATGGTVTEISSGNFVYRVHTFTTVGQSSFNISTSISGSKVDYLVVAGGGGGGGGYQGGGGGAGGLLSGNINLSSGSYTITVGFGGTGVKQTGPLEGSTNGGNSSIGSVIQATGGGRGAYEIFGGTSATTGGSGGGGSHPVLTGAAGISGQGFAGGDGLSIGNFSGGGGGGASGAGTTATSGVAAPAGGPGTQSSINGSSVTYSAGGTGRNRNTGNTDGTSGSNNTGNGGNAGASTIGNALGGNGGSGIVIIRYPIGIRQQ